MYYHLSPLSEQETWEYVNYRLKIASGSNRKYFEDDALHMVYQFSKGVPRLINQICDFALLTGFVDELTIIDAKTMQEVIGESPVNQFKKQKMEFGK